MAAAAAKIQEDFADGSGPERVGNMGAPVPAEAGDRQTPVVEVLAGEAPGWALPSVFADRIRPAGEYSDYT